jgi:hypothetical protein
MRQQQIDLEEMTRPATQDEAVIEWEQWIDLDAVLRPMS